MGKALSTYKKLFAAVKDGKVASVYFLYGTETYIKREFSRAVIDAALPPENRAFNLDIVFGDSFDPAAFDERLGSFALFTATRVVVLRNFEALTLAHKDHVIASVDNVESGVTLIIEADVPALDSARLRNLKKATDTVGGVTAEFAHLDEDETIQRATATLRKANKAIDRDAMDALIESVGPKLIDLNNELEKLILAADGERIDREIVADVVGKYRVDSVFSLLDVLSRRNAGDWVRQLDELLDGGEEPYMLLGMLLKRVTLLLAMKTSPAGTEVPGVSGFYARVLRGQAQKLDEQLLWRLLHNLRWADLKLKSTALPARTLMEQALLASSTGQQLQPN